MNRGDFRRGVRILIAYFFPQPAYFRVGVGEYISGAGKTRGGGGGVGLWGVFETPAPGG